MSWINFAMNIEWLTQEEETIELSQLIEVSDEKWANRMEYINLRDDLICVATAAEIHQDIEFDTKMPIPLIGSWTSGHVLLQGDVDVEYVDGGQDDWIANTAYFTTLKNWEGHYRIRGQQQLRHFNYTIRADALSSMLDGKVPRPLEGLISPGLDRSIMLRLPIVERMRVITDSLLTSPLTGQLRSLEMEGAVMQLVALMAYSFEKSENDLPYIQADVKQIAEAREILLSNIANPPSLGALAKQIKLSEKRLNAGFKAQYGTTAFEFLRNARLDHAKYAIANEAVPLKHIAHRVGYNHVTNFINAFTKRFGYPPRSYSKKTKLL